MRSPATFNLDDPADWLGKLQRELQRCRQATNPAEIADHAINFSMTAWHMYEWVWSRIKTDAEFKAAWAKRAGIAAKDFDCDAFGRALCNPPFGCIEFDHCRVVATSAKHIGVDHNQLGMSTAVSASSPVKTDDFGSDPAGVVFSVIGEPTWVPKIVLADERKPALPVFEKAYAFWELLVTELKNGEPS